MKIYSVFDPEFKRYGQIVEGLEDARAEILEALADGTMSTIKTTEMLALNIYSTFYGQNPSARGMAQAKAVIFFVLVAAIGLIQLRATRDKEVQQ